jgi:hypothetical protein
MYLCSNCQLWIGEENTLIEPSRPCPACTAARERSEPRPPVHFDECECGGAFDGFCVTSDADPGL